MASIFVYSFSVIATLDGILPSIVPVCKSNFIEPSVKGNVVLSKDWFILGQLYSYCIQVSNVKNFDVYNANINIFFKKKILPFYLITFFIFK